MTRSVEIPEAAYEEATDAIAAMLQSWPASASVPHHPDLSPRDVLRAFAICALEAAALSYLVPAGDAGLREALERFADEVGGKSYDGAVTYSHLTRILRAMLAEHHATPQPAGEAHERVAEFIRQRERMGGQGELVYTVHADPEAEPAPLLLDDLRALVAAPAVPQPVDREALTQALLHVWRGRIEAQVADSPEGHCAAFADAMLVLLGGSETCDHSDYVTDDEAKARCGNCGKLMSAVLAGEQEQSRG